ncbi:hypothetical protein O0L34_g7699 [Tuta absoluta]|nr:hypothetical protein O0L34_g7699 [Tuta absoluta]
MHCVYFLLLPLLVAVCSGGEVNSLEDLDLESLLKDENQRRAAFDCLMDKGPCGELQKLRDSLPQLVETKCGQCTPKQKEKFDQVNKMLFSKYPKEYQDLVLKYSSKSD